MDNEQWDDRMRAFRFFDIDGKRQQGDRFLQPWLFGHVYVLGFCLKSECRWVMKELKCFFD